MGVKVRIPTPLRRVAQGQELVELTCSNLGQCIDVLEERFPGMRERLCDDDGEVRRFVNIYINGEDMRFLDGMATALKEGDEVSIVPAVAGGLL